MPISVVDIFAGPGGLNEGFASVADDRGRAAFDVVLSIEMNRYAHETLLLRVFFRQFRDNTPLSYYRYLRGEIARDALYLAHESESKLARAKCWQATLGPDGEHSHAVRKRIDVAIGAGESWVLIGGPPCQAYSVAGRSRNHGKPGYERRPPTRRDQITV